jgi:hypothetical protein
VYICMNWGNAWLGILRFILASIVLIKSKLASRKVITCNEFGELDSLEVGRC